MAYLNMGSGADGDITISGTFDCNTMSSIQGRTAGDAARYSCASVGSNSVQTVNTPTGLSIGDEVMLMCYIGSSSSYDNVGNYEFFRIGDIQENTITFTTSKTKYYGANGGDTNIAGTHKVAVMRVPNYRNLTIPSEATYTATAFNGTHGGVICFRVRELLINQGTINAKALGYRGGTCYIGGFSYGNVGETYGGYGPSNSVNGVRGGGGGAGYYNGWGAAGGGYGTAGQGVLADSGGKTYGVANLSKIFFGGPGGGSNAGENHGQTQQTGGRGGGIVMIYAARFNNYGVIDCNGGQCVPADTQYNMYIAGPGAGGSILINAGTFYKYSSTIRSLTGEQANSGGGSRYNAGKGRIALFYKSIGDNITGIDPAPHTDATLEAPFKIAGLADQPGYVYLYRPSDGSYVDRKYVETGEYEFFTPTDEAYTVIGIPIADNRNCMFYKSIVPIQTIIYS
jgi:hypothetical protein